MNGYDIRTQNTHEALGAHVAQRLLDGPQDAETIKARAWLAFVELAASAGSWKSAACAAFIGELSKRAAAP